MRAFIIFLAYFLSASPSFGQKNKQPRAVGDQLSQQEYAAIEDGIDKAMRYPFKPVMIKKHDINGDGHADIVATIAPGLTTFVFLALPGRNKSYEMHHGTMRLRNDDAKFGSIEFLPSQTPPHVDVMIRTPSDCGVATLHRDPRLPPNQRLAFEMFDCRLTTRDYFLKRAECPSRGGTWGPDGIRQYGRCTRPTSDGGKPCTDGSECEAKCLYSGPAIPDGTMVSGTCADTNRGFGCFVTILKGKPMKMCVD